MHSWGVSSPSTCLRVSADAKTLCRLIHFDPSTCCPQPQVTRSITFSSNQNKVTLVFSHFLSSNKQPSTLIRISRRSGVRFLQIGPGKNQVIVGFTVRGETSLWCERSPAVLSPPRIHSHSMGRLLSDAGKGNTFLGIASIQTPETLFWRYKTKFAKFFFHPR
jgi:hypothetical protein